MTTAHLTKRSRQQTSGTARGFYFLNAVCIFLCLALIVSCSTTASFTNESRAQSGALFPPAFSWTPICEGASYATYQNACTYTIVQIDLAASGIRIATYPQKQAPGRGITCKRFAQKTGSVIACNTTPYSGLLFSRRALVGVQVSASIQYAEPNKRYDALLLTKEAHGFSASIAAPQSTQTCAAADYAIGGYWQILRDGEVVQSFAHIYDARLACGISKDGRTLYLLAVEGGRFHRRGLTYPECAEILSAAGAYNALEFDGGSSTSLVVNGKNMLSYPVLTRNAAYLGFSF